MLTDRLHGPVEESRAHLAAKVGGIAWAVFFIWLALAFLTGMSFGTGLLGVALITLGAQLARFAFQLPLERFWLVAGTLFAVAAIWSLLNLALPFVPVVLLAIGVVMLVGALRKQ